MQFQTIVQWSHSGISQHHQHCDEPFDTANCEVIKTFSNKNKKKLNYDLKVWEALEIKKNNCGPGRGLNEDGGPTSKQTRGTLFSTPWTNWRDLCGEGGGGPALFGLLTTLAL